MSQRKKTIFEEVETTNENLAPKVTSMVLISTNISFVPFPNRFANSKEEHKEEVLETFFQMKIHIPLLVEIRQVPRDGIL